MLSLFSCKREKAIQKLPSLRYGTPDRRGRCDPIPLTCARFYYITKKIELEQKISNRS